MHRVSKHGWGGMLSDFPKGGASQSGFHVSFGSSGLSDGWPLLPEGVGLEHMGASDVFFQLGRGSVAVTEFSLLWEGMPAPPGGDHHHLECMPASQHLFPCATSPGEQQTRADSSIPHFLKTYLTEACSL